MAKKKKTLWTFISKVAHNVYFNDQQDHFEPKLKKFGKKYENIFIVCKFWNKCVFTHSFEKKKAK